MTQFIGYVSDERYVALADVLLEFEKDGQSVAVVRSTPRGAVYVGDHNGSPLPPGAYRVTLVRDGFGSKSVTMQVGPNTPYQFRLLSDGLLGYAWPKWVRAGERSEFRVHSVESYRLSLWRYGLQKEFVKLLGWYDEHGPRAVMQITPDGDFTQTGVQWNKQGYGSPHHTQLVAGPERSGLYYFHAETESGKFFSFPWIVAPAQPQAKIAVLASNITWNAYNNYGGRSNYINSNRLPDQPVVNSRLDLIRYTMVGSFNVWGFHDEEYAPLSFDRPELSNHVPRDTEATDPIRGRTECGHAPAEWRLLAWLERENFDYDFYAETQLHDGTLDLDAYQVLILSVHPEYWTRQMVQRVKEWVHKRGGKLMYLGGNGLNCEVEMLGEATTVRLPSGAGRTAALDGIDGMRCKTHLAPTTGGALGMPDANNPDVYLESRMHRTHESEASLLGVVTTESGIMTAAPYRAIHTNHWVFAGTGVRDGDLFGAHSLHERVPGGASGHETDKMSKSSPRNTVLLAKGINPDEGGSEMVYYDTTSGGAVFSVGSITWPSCILVDPDISRITANVITRFLE